jgi:hypothetical protein
VYYYGRQRILRFLKDDSPSARIPAQLSEILGIKYPTAYRWCRKLHRDGILKKDINGGYYFPDGGITEHDDLDYSEEYHAIEIALPEDHEKGGGIPGTTRKNSIKVSQNHPKVLYEGNGRTVTYTGRSIVIGCCDNPLKGQEVEDWLMRYGRNGWIVRCHIGHDEEGEITEGMAASLIRQGYVRTGRTHFVKENHHVYQREGVCGKCGPVVRYEGHVFVGIQVRDRIRERRAARCGGPWWLFGGGCKGVRVLESGGTEGAGTSPAPTCAPARGRALTTPSGSPSIVGERGNSCSYPQK